MKNIDSAGKTKRNCANINRTSNKFGKNSCNENQVIDQFQVMITNQMKGLTVGFVHKNIN